MAYQFYAIIQSYFYYPLINVGDWVFGETKKYVGLQLHANDSIYYGWLRYVEKKRYPSCQRITVYIQRKSTAGSDN